MLFNDRLEYEHRNCTAVAIANALAGELIGVIRGD